jgi:tetrahydromethanopterin S-methyltransferase subunit E
MNELNPMWKPLIVYLSTFLTVFTNIIEGIHSVLSLLVVMGSLVFIIYQIIEKEKNRREYNRRNKDGK